MTGQKIKNKKGFTLLETLVAISIIGIALTTATAAFQNGLQTSGVVKDQITAYYLAQDAMEYIIALRNMGAAGMYVTGAPQVPSWTSNLLQCMPTDQTGGIDIWCQVDTYKNSIESYSNQQIQDPKITGANITPTWNPSSIDPLYVCDEPLPAPMTGTSQVFTRSNDGNNCKRSKFSRTVHIQPVQCLTGCPAGGLTTASTDMNTYTEAVVTVKVMWGSGQQYSLVEDLYNWQPPQFPPQ